MVKHTRDPKNIEQTNDMKEARKCMKKMSTFGWSEVEVRAKLISTLAIAHYFVTFIVLITMKVTNDVYLLL